MKYLTVVFVGMLLLATQVVSAQEAAGAAELGEAEGLVKLKGRFQETWVRPESDFSRFRSVAFEIAELQFRDATVERNYRSRAIDSGSNEFGLTEDEQETYRQLVAEALSAELHTSSKLDVVDRPMSGTLLVRASILDIVCNIPPDSAGDVRVYPSSIGAGTVRFELVDSDSGEVQARLEERSTIRPPGQTMHEVSRFRIDRTSMWAPIARWYRAQASELRRVLEKAVAGKPLGKYPKR